MPHCYLCADPTTAFSFGLKQQLAVKVVGAYVVCNFIVMETLYFGVWCRPFYNYWAVPTPNGQYWKGSWRA